MGSGGTIRYGSANKTVEAPLLCGRGIRLHLRAPGCLAPFDRRRAPFDGLREGADDEAVLIAATLALAVTLIEGVARRGRDNLFIPIGTYFILAALLDLDILDCSSGSSS